MEERIYTDAELQAFFQAGPELFRLGLVVEEGAEGTAHNTAQIGAFFQANPGYPITVENIVRAVTEYIKDLKWKNPAKIAFDKLGLTQQESDVLFSLIARRDLDPNYALENATAIAEWIRSSGRGIGPQSIDLAIGNLPNTPAGAWKLHWKRRLQDREKEILAEREKNRAELEANRNNSAETQRLNQQAKELMNPEIRLSEKAKAWRDAMNRPPQKVQMTESTPPTDYWKGRCESAIASLPVMDRPEAQQIMDSKKGGSYETAHTFILTYTQRRLRERASAAQLARMGR